MVTSGPGTGTMGSSGPISSPCSAAGEGARAGSSPGLATGEGARAGFVTWLGAPDPDFMRLPATTPTGFGVPVPHRPAFLNGHDTSSGTAAARRTRSARLVACHSHGAIAPAPSSPRCTGSPRVAARKVRACATGSRQSHAPCVLGSVLPQALPSAPSADPRCKKTRQRIGGKVVHIFGLVLVLGGGVDSLAPWTRTHIRIGRRVGHRARGRAILRPSGRATRRPGRPMGWGWWWRPARPWPSRTWTS